MYRDEKVFDLLQALADLGGELYRDDNGATVLVLDEDFVKKPLGVAYQPTYPLGANLANVQEVDGKVWLAAGGGDTYAPKAAWHEA